jgi:hypothetical protein
VAVGACDARSTSAHTFHPLDAPAEKAGATAAWTGVTSNCEAGDVAGNWRASTVGRINLYREMCGLDNVTNEPTMSADAQQGALIISATTLLTHYPDSSSECYTAAGAAANAASNIAIGVTGPQSIDGYIDDRGAHNARVGHRWWKLLPDLEYVGTGDSGTAVYQSASSTDVYANNIMVNGNARPNGINSVGSGRTAPAYVAWPPRGFCPFTLLPTSGRWSVFKSGGGFDAPGIQP